MSEISLVAYNTHDSSKSFNCNIGDVFAVVSPGGPNYTYYLNLNGATVLSHDGWNESGIGGGTLAFVKATSTTITFSGNSGTIFGFFRIS